jgi:hypothetical protein
MSPVFAWLVVYSVMDGPDLGMALPAVLLYLICLPLFGFISAREPRSLESTESQVGIPRRGRTIWVPWAAIRGVSVKRSVGAKYLVFFAEGGPFWASAPYDGVILRDPDFDERVEQLGRCWIEYRGPQWLPDPRYDPNGVRRDDRRPPLPPGPLPAT